jgi:hypothetical protein
MDLANHLRTHGHAGRQGDPYLPGRSCRCRTRNERSEPAPPRRFSWSNRLGFFGGSPQSLAADYILEGATGVSGHVDEPYLAMTPRPDLLLPAYYQGRNLAESRGGVR